MLERITEDKQTPPAGPGGHAGSAYLARLERYRAESNKVQRQLAWVGNTRFGLFVAGFLTVWLAFLEHITSGFWILVPLVPFATLTAWTERLRRREARARLGMAYYERGLARVEDRWQGAGVPGSEYLPPDHPCAADLDLFGKGSLFERLCDCATRSGRDTLAGWLLAPANPATVAERQGAVRDLRDRMDWREQVATLGLGLRNGIDTRALADWGRVPGPPPTRAAALARWFVYAWLSAALAAGADLVSPALPALALAAQGVFALVHRERVRRALEGLERAAGMVGRLSGVVLAIESARFSDRHLVRRQAALNLGGVAPSRRLSELATLLRRLEDRRNLFFGIVAPFLLWTTRTALMLEVWRRSAGPALADWMTVVGEIEALDSLAGYAFENPADPFPEVVAYGPVLVAQRISHPLLARGRAVANDIRLGDPLRLLIVSGSNMSGKSTFLRAVGVNAVLALAGGPVRAASLRLSPLAIGATMRIQDSLLEGRSRFYTEITRLRQIVELAKGPVPVLFLLDEVLHGTNSHDRLIGAEGVLRGLLRLPTIGLVTTHDLALTAVADSLAPSAANVHFADEMVQGEMQFDYRLRESLLGK